MHLSLDMEFIKKVLMKRLSCKDYTEMWLGLRTRDSGHQRLATVGSYRASRTEERHVFLELSRKLKWQGIYMRQLVVVSYSEDRSRKRMEDQGRMALAEWVASGE